MIITKQNLKNSFLTQLNYCIIISIIKYIINALIFIGTSLIGLNLLAKEVGNISLKKVGNAKSGDHISKSGERLIIPLLNNSK